MSILQTFLKKGQVSMEFLVILGLIMVTFSVFYTVISHKQLEANEFIAKLRGETVAERIAYELDLAVSQDTNFTRTFEIPQTILGQNYSVYILDAENFTRIYLELIDQNYTAFSAASQILGTIGPGKNILINSGGVINVSPS